MRRFILAGFILSLLVLLSSADIPAQADELEGTSPQIDWTNPDSIDPSTAGVESFLDLDLASWQRTANEAYQSGDYEKAAKYYLACVRSNVTDSGLIYNLACCYGLMGNADMAAFYVEHAVKAGFSDVDWISQDPDFNNVRGTDVFDTAMAGLEAQSAAQQAGLGVQLFTESTALFGCRVHLPDNFDPDRTYTLVIGLHGYGDNADHFGKLWDKFASPDFIYASPEAPYAFSAGANLGYSWTAEGPGAGGETWMRSAELTDAYVVNLIGQLKTAYHVDKVILLGFSQGAFFTYKIGIMHPDIFAGLIVFGGGLETDMLSSEDIAAGSSLPVFIAHGLEDRIIDIQQGINARDTLMENGYNVTWHEFEGGHSVPEEALQAAQEWMKGLR